MKSNSVKSILQNGGTVIGSEVMRIPSAEVVRVYAAAGFDFAFIDMEVSSALADHVYPPETVQI